MTDFYNEDGDSSLDYSNQQDFYTSFPQSSALEFEAFEQEEQALPNEMNDPLPPEDDPELPKDEPEEPEPPTEIEIGEKWYQLTYYRRFSNIDTKEFLLRLANTFVPVKSFYSLTQTNPDLYGLIWITTSLVFAVAAASNFASYLTHAINNDTKSWTYDFAKLTIGAATIYIYALVVPFLVWVACKLWLELEPTVVHHYCIFGYSFSAFIPASIVMVVPIELARWAIMILACCLVIAFLLRSYIPICMPKIKQGAVILVAIVILTILLALVLQIYFFEYSLEPINTNSNNSDLSSDEQSSTETDQTPTPSPSVEPSPTPSPSPSAAESQSLSPTPQPSQSLSPSSQPSESAQPSESPSPSPPEGSN